MANPYESPRTHDANQEQNSKQYFTRKRVFWWGLGGIIAALVMVSISQAMFVESRRLGNALDAGVVAIDIIAAILFLVGIISLVVYHWFPDPSRKYSWHRKKS